MGNFVSHWNPTGIDHARMHANLHHVKAKQDQKQRERDMHHNIAEASEQPGEREPSLISRLWRRLFG
jgi:hypothetical protein